MSSLSTVHAVTEGGHICLYSPYSALNRDLCRAIPGGRWNKYRRRWEYPINATVATAVLASFPNAMGDAAFVRLLPPTGPFCRQCGTAYTASAVFCPNQACGKVVEDIPGVMVVVPGSCWRCHRPIDLADAYCAACGTPTTVPGSFDRGPSDQTLGRLLRIALVPTVVFAAISAGPPFGASVTGWIAYFVMVASISYWPAVVIVIMAGVIWRDIRAAIRGRRRRW